MCTTKSGCLTINELSILCSGQFETVFISFKSSAKFLVTSGGRWFLHSCLKTNWNGWYNITEY